MFRLCNKINSCHSNDVKTWSTTSEMVWTMFLNFIALHFVEAEKISFFLTMHSESLNHIASSICSWQFNKGNSIIKSSRKSICLAYTYIHTHSHSETFLLRLFTLWTICRYENILNDKAVWIQLKISCHKLFSGIVFFFFFFFFSTLILTCSELYIVIVL